MPESPQVSVVIPTHRRREAVGRALRSLEEQTADPASFEVIVSVDGSEDGTLEMLEELNLPYDLRWVSGSRLGRAGACNAAIREARGEVLVILDDDMVAEPQLLERHRGHHPAGTRLCVLGAVPVSLNGSSPRAAAYVKRKFDAHLARLTDPDHLNLPRSFYTGNASLRAEVMREVGGFDEGFGFYGNEDVDLALRLRESGVELGYDAQALAHQGYDKDLGGLQRDTFEKGGTTVLLSRRHPSVFGSLRLASPHAHSRPWLSVRSVLLAATRSRPGSSRRVFAVASLLERLGLWRVPRFYDAVLDYAFWAGVAVELEEASDEGKLAELAEDLNRGPIDLLLHG